MLQTVDLDQLLARKRALGTRASESRSVLDRLRDLRLWQSRRLAQTYNDLSSDPRYAPAIGFFPPPQFTVNGVPVDVSAEWMAALQALGYDQTSLLELFYGRVIGSPDARIPLMIVANGFTAQELGDKIGQKLSLELGVPVPEPSALLLLPFAGCAAFVRRRGARSAR